MIDIARTLLVLSCVTAALFLLLRLFSHWTQKHFSAAWHYYSQILLYSFFLIPYYKLLAKWDLGFRYTLLRASAIVPDQAAAQQANQLPLTVTIGSSPNGSGSYRTSDRIVPFIERAWDILPYVLAAGTFVFLAVTLYQMMRLHRRMNRICEPVEDPFLLEVLVSCKRQMGIRRAIPLQLSPYISTPFLYGVLKPRIILPSGIAFSKEEIRHILLHEFTHFKRHDIGFKVALLLIHSLHWFNPLAYLARRDIDHYCELSCDEQIVRSMSREERKRYSALLLHVLWKVADQRAGLVFGFQREAEISGEENQSDYEQHERNP